MAGKPLLHSFAIGLDWFKRIHGPAGIHERFEHVSMMGTHINHVVVADSPCEQLKQLQFKRL